MGLVAKAVVEVHIPRADQRRDAVQDIAHVALGALQLRTHRLAALQLACEEHGQRHGRQHEREGEQPQPPSRAVPLLENGGLGLGHIQDQRKAPHVLEGIRALHPIQRRTPHKAAFFLLLKADHVGRACNALSHVRVTIGKARDDDTIVAEQIDAAVLAQIHRGKQLVEVAQPHRAQHNAAKLALGSAKAARQGQRHDPGNAGGHRPAHKQALMPPLLERQEIIPVGNVGLARLLRARIQNHIALGIDHHHIAQCMQAHHAFKANDFPQAIAHTG